MEGNVKKNNKTKVITYAISSLVGLGAISAGLFYMSDGESEASYIKNIEATGQVCQISSGAKGILKDVYISDTALYSLKELANDKEFTPAVASGTKINVTTNIGEFYYEIPKFDTEDDLKNYLAENKKLDVADMCVIPLTEDGKTVGTATEGFKFKVTLPSNKYRFTKYESGNYSTISSKFKNVSYDSNDITVLANVKSQKSTETPEKLEAELKFKIQSTTTSIEVTKLGTKNQNLGEGFEFALINSTDGSKVATAKTNDDGVALFENIPVGIKYVVHEMKRGDSKGASKQTIEVKTSNSDVKSLIEVSHNGAESSDKTSTKEEEKTENTLSDKDVSELTDKEKEYLKYDDPSTPDIIEGLPTDADINLPGEAYQPSVGGKPVWNGLTEEDIKALKGAEEGYCYMESTKTTEYGCEEVPTKEELAVIKQKQKDDAESDAQYEKEVAEGKAEDDAWADDVSKNAEKYKESYDKVTDDDPRYNEDIIPNNTVPNEPTNPQDSTTDNSTGTSSTPEDTINSDDIENDLNDDGSDTSVNDNEPIGEGSSELPQTGSQTSSLPYALGGLFIALSSLPLIKRLRKRNNS